jgi:NTE family protein
MQSASHLIVGSAEFSIVGSAEFSSSTNPGPGGGGQTRPAGNRRLRLVHSADPKRREERLLSDLLAHLPALRPLFEGLAEEKALAVENALEWVDLPAGSALFTIGDVALDAFVLTAGRLGVKVGSDLQARTVASIHPGEIVGEMALLGAEPRSATIMAEHDSHLIRLPREAFTVLLDSAPEARHYLFGVLTSRLRHTSLGSHPNHDAAETIAIIPLGSPEPVRGTLDWLARRVSPVIVGSACQEDRWSQGRGTPGQRIVYMSDNHHSGWSRRCVDQADRVIFVAAAGSHAIGVDAVTAAARLNREATLVLVNRPDAALPRGAGPWLDHFPHSQIVHVRKGDESDHERLLRVIRRASLCLVLSGGGARALAHIGAIQALEEAGMEIDAVAGTSMGALIGALVAKNVKAREIRDRMRCYLIDNNPVREYTLPFVSLVRGRKLTRMFQDACEHAAIEDLWKTFFCVSADLATSKAVVHRSGPLWRALRASSAIPGVFPPVMSHGQMLVDGCIVDNMPTGTMRSLNRGLVLGVDVSSAGTLPACEIAVEQKSWAWLLLGGRNKAPSMAQILMSSGAIGCGSQRASARAAADFLVEPRVADIGMLSFTALDRAIEAGYWAMQQAIPKLRASERLLAASLQ